MANGKKNGMGMAIVGFTFAVLGLIFLGDGKGAIGSTLLIVGLVFIGVGVVAGRQLSIEGLSFTPKAQQSLALARIEAQRLNHNFIGTEHLLLGLIALGQGIAVNVLTRMGLDLETLRTEVEKQVGTGPDEPIIGNIPYTPRVNAVLNLAGLEAKALNHTYVGTEHILLGILAEGDGVAGHVLRKLRVDIQNTRQLILKELDPNYP